MKLQILQEDLSRALINASRFTSAHAQLPVLGNIMLSTKKTKLQVLATNLEISILISVGAKIEEEGKITVPAKVISEAISNLDLGLIDLESQKEELKVKTQKTNLTISGMNPSDFPKVAESINPKASISMPRQDLLGALSTVSFATSIDETRPQLTGVLFLFEKDALTLVATDGFRLSQNKIKLSENKKLFDKIILPKNVLSEVSRLSPEDSDIVLNFNQDENQAIFGFTDTVLSSRTIEGDFPDFTKIIPKDKNVSVFVEKDDILRAVKLASTFARDSANVVKVAIDKDAIEISAESSAAGSQKTKIEAKVEGPPLEIAFNYRFLEEFLNAAVGPEISIELSSSSSPGVFRDPKNVKFLHLIMPVRIQE
ncbi:DNA polymerase III subunit beta [Candidatus Woesebacteria bacterium RIFOXYA1_FULL_40_18]|uniref:Beta sliding clamp n=1 Tax=Candidatus Woesebacteria bacterium RIFOXYA1_FULL_40_18 TaxID=1802532 RepID=A0A1F8CKY6_9BACT|nr:MAG: DNA polymerase III subunit beta [Candidatus Woesebacteria bacterium RIFOXYA1_FULL_40_18]